MGKLKSEPLIRQKLFEKGITLIGSYNGMQGIAKLKCLKNHVWEATIGNTVYKSGCPTCFLESRLYTIEGINQAYKKYFVEAQSDYKNTKTPCTWKCSKGHTFKATARVITNRKGCPVCKREVAKNKRQKEIETFLAQSGIVLKSEYIPNGKLKLICQHGHEYEKPSYNIKQSHNCPICVKNKTRLSHELVQNRLSKFGISLIGQYEYATKKTSFRCINGHIWTSTSHEVMGGAGCPVCSGNSKQECKNRFLNQAAINNYTVMEEYINAKTPIHLKCSKGHIFKIAPTYAKRMKCLTCEGKTSEQVKARFLQKLQVSGYKLIGEYKNANTPAWVECQKAHKFKTTQHKLDAGRKCPSCNRKGLDVSKLVTFYVYKIEMGNQEFLGFGISTDFKQRHSHHLGAFKKKNIKWDLLLCVDFKNGRDALEVESKIKRLPQIVDIGIKGFRKECLPISEKSTLMAYLKN